MKSSEIATVIDKFKNSSSPYRCILISGQWGIGKTYEIKKSCTDDIYISLFGLSHAEDIYKSILTNLPDNKKWRGPLREKLGKVYIIINKISDNKIGFNISDFLSLKELVIKNADKLSGRIIIFDDFERISKNLNIEDVFGVFDALLSTDKIKIILVANEEAIVNKEDFKKYQEKIIDRTHVIDDPSYDITKNDNKYDEIFVSDFMQKHNFKNLRTLQRAQRFFEDVCNELSQCLSNDDFKNLIKKICYAIVFEATEKTYSEKVKAELEADNQSRNNTSNTLLNLLLQDELSLIDHFYISSGNMFGESNRELIYTIIEYYRNGTKIDENVVTAKQSVYVQGYQKIDFFKSQEEIEELLAFTESQIYESPLSIKELIDKANLICTWKSILGKEISNDLFTFIFDKLFDSYSNEFHFNPDKEESFIIAQNSHYLEFVSATVVKELLRKVFKEIKNHYFDLFVEKLHGAIQNKDYIECDSLSKLLKRYFDYGDYKESLVLRTKNILGEVLVEDFAPRGSIEEKHYSSYKRLIRICYKLDSERTTMFLDNLTNSNPVDLMLEHRIKVLTEELLNSSN